MGNKFLMIKVNPLTNMPSALIWSPSGKTGTFYFSASAIDSSGNVPSPHRLLFKLARGMNMFLPFLLARWVHLMMWEI